MFTASGGRSSVSGQSVSIRSQVAGDVVLSRRPNSWDGFLSLCKTTAGPADFVTESEREQGTAERDPLDSHTP
jgi:antitoxin VapB